MTDTRQRSSRRIVPPRLDDAQRQRLRELFMDPDTWVLRPSWERYLIKGDRAALVRTNDLNTDHVVAALAWVRQQRHAIYRQLEGGAIAPDGWIESLPLTARLLELSPPDVPAITRR